jgi:GABA(A) receptor-associated protein
MGHKDAPFIARLRESTIIRQRYPDRIPIIVEKATASKDNIPVIAKSKYLCPGQYSFGQFVYIIRRQIQLPPEVALFVFVNSTLVQSSALMKDVYAQYADMDGYLYMSYSGESTFGAQGGLKGP